LYEAPIYIDDTSTLTPLELRAKCRRLKSLYDIRCVIVDYLQLMHLGSGRVESRQQEITTISRYLKALARELNIPVVVLSQLNRSPEGREGHTPRMSDLRESGSIEQDADVVVLLHREDYYHRGDKEWEANNKADLIIAKQRNGSERDSHGLRTPLTLKNRRCVWKAPRVRKKRHFRKYPRMTKSYLCFFICTALLGSGSAFGQGEEERVLGRYMISTIEFKFVGKRTYKNKRLLGKLGFKEGETIDAVLAEFGREDLKEFYLQNGFAFAEVELDRQKVSQGNVIYTITEGPRVKVRSVRFTGNKAVKKGTLKKALKIRKKKWFLWGPYYSEEKLFEDVERLQNVYWERGFLDYSVTAKKEFSKDKKKIRITFMIEEGPVYIIDEVVLTGARKIYEVDINGRLDEQTLLARLGLGPGQAYRKRQAASDRKKLLKLYRENGFINVAVDLQVDKVIAGEDGVGKVLSVSEGRVNVKFNIREGQPFRIGRIDIMGNQKMLDKVVRRVLDGFDFQPGRWFDAEVVRGDGSGELEKEVRRSVYAQEATITPVAGAQPDQKNAEVQIKEGQTGQVVLGAGVSSDLGVIGSLILEQRNFDIKDWPDSFGEFITGQAFKGAGQRLRIALEPGTEFSQYSINFTEPYLRDKPISLNVGSSDYVWARESYDEGRTKGYFGFAERHEKRTRTRWRRNISFRVENVDVQDIDFDAPQEIKDVGGDNFLTSVKLGIGKDLTYNVPMPSEGRILKGSYEQVTGDDTFGVFSATYARYTPIYEDLAERKTVLATRVQAGVIWGDAPPFEKFYAGGMRSIRGFDYRGVSPRGLQTNVANPERKDPIGSDWLFLANAEIIAPMVGESLSGLLFIDSGTVDSGTYRASIGTGVQLLIPQWFGPVPMRIGLAAPISKDDLDDTQAFFFSMGRLF
jgi:outer membrane protein insertion porin family